MIKLFKDSNWPSTPPKSNKADYSKIRFEKDYEEFSSKNFDDEFSFLKFKSPQFNEKQYKFQISIF